VQVRVGVAEQPAEQHPVGARPDAGDHVGRLETGLLDVGEVALRILVQHHPADLDRWVVAVRPDLGEVEGIEAVISRIRERHHLHLERPRGMVTGLDGVVEVLYVGVGIRRRHRVRFVLGEEVDPLVGLEVVFDPDLVATFVDPHEGVARVAVHVAPGLRYATVRHQDGHLVGGLR
jgi:hypothetical protein